MILSKVLNSSRAFVSKSWININSKNAISLQMLVRHGGGGGPRMLRFKTVPKTNFLKIAVKYFLIGFIPGILIISYCNLFIGNARLYDHDPDVFEPEFWEYYKHPITRFLARYCMEDPKLSYYKDIYMIETAERDAKQARLIKQVHHLQHMEQEGMIEWQRNPSLPRYALDDMDEYYDKNLKDLPPKN